MELKKTPMPSTAAMWGGELSPEVQATLTMYQTSLVTTKARERAERADAIEAGLRAHAAGKR